MDSYRDSNRALWDRWAEMCVASEAYDVWGFKAGKVSLHTLESDEVGDVAEKARKCRDLR